MKKNSAGFTLVQTLIALSLGTVVALGIGAVLVVTQKEQHKKSAQVTLQNIANDVRLSAASRTAMDRSALENRTSGQTPYLAACVCGESICHPNTPYGLDLYNTSGEKLTNSQALQYYNNNGEACLPPVANCIFQAAATFQCLGQNCGTNSINESDPVLRISYVIKPINPAAAAPIYGDLATINSPAIEITADSIRHHALQNNLCVQVSSLTPTSGPSSGGTTLIFSGAGLNRVTSIHIGSPLFACSITARSNVEIRCTTPSSSAGAKNVVLNYGASEKIQMTNGFTYTNSFGPPVCSWQLIGTYQPGGFGVFPPCRAANNGERFQMGSNEYECQCI